MPLPLLAAAVAGGKFLGQFGMGQATQAASNIVSASFQPPLLSIAYSSWNNRPRVLPTSDAILAAGLRGFLSPLETEEWLRWHGIAWVPRGDQSPVMRDGDVIEGTDIGPRSRLWHAVSQSMLTIPDASLLMHWWNAGLITQDDAHKWLRLSGASVDAWHQARQAMGDPMPLDIAFDARNRGLLTPAQFDSVLKRLGFYQAPDRNALDAMRAVQPSVNDLIGFAVRDLWDRDYVANVRPYDGVPPEFLAWSQKLGMHGPTGLTANVDGRDTPLSLAHLYWGAHWQPISPNQSYEMLHRLRPSRIERYRRQGWNVRAFTTDDVKRWLRVADYPAGIRDYLGALSYAPLRLVDIRNALILSERSARDAEFRRTLPTDLRGSVATYNRQWAVEQFQDRGLHPDDAAVSADLAVAAAAQKGRQGIQRFLDGMQLATVKAVLEQYREGLILRPEASTRLQMLTLTFDQAERALLLEDMRAAAKEFKAALAAVRRDYMAGGLDDTEARASVNRILNYPDRAASIVRGWKLRRDLRSRAATVAMVREWVAQDLITPDDAKLRLERLGWRFDALEHLAAQMRQTKQAAQRRNDAARALEAHKRVTEFEHSERAMVKALKDAQAEARRQAPQSSVKRWLKSGLIDAEWAARAYRRHGLSEEAIQLRLSEIIGEEMAAATLDAIGPPEAARTPQLPPEMAPDMPPAAGPQLTPPLEPNQRGATNGQPG